MSGWDDPDGPPDYRQAVDPGEPRAYRQALDPADRATEPAADPGTPGDPGAPAPGSAPDLGAVATSIDAGDPGESLATEPAPAAGRRLGRNRFVVAGVLLLTGSALAWLALAASGRLDPEPSLPPSHLFEFPTAPPSTTDPAVAGAVIDSFVALVTEPGLAYEVRLTSTLTSGGESARTQAVGKVAGTDVDVHLARTRAPGGPVDFGGRVIVKGKRAWVQLDGQPRWRKGAPEVGVMPNVRPFDGIATAQDLVYVGQEVRRGSLTHHLVTSPGWQPGPAAATLPELPGFSPAFVKMDVWTTDDGRPIEAHAVGHFTRGSLGEAATATATAVEETTWVIGSVGGPVTITAPQ